MTHDYKSIKFKSGLEIHQQLEGEKLFCDCPTTIIKEKPDFTIKRILRASAGESGKIDIAAKHEEEKQKYFVYQGYNDLTCLVELDEEPPGPVNEEALKIALQVATLLNCQIVDEIQFMRKTVIDGSNVSGFQRTALVGIDGHIDVNGKKITIPTVCLEEEAAQTIERTKEYDTYNLSRLGIPLVEIATGPDITTPEECREVAGKLGMILRSVPGMKRGIGSIRQDVNVSINDGSRVEIKGFQDFKNIPKAIDNEIERQLDISKKGEKMEPHVRKVNEDLSTTFLRPMPGAARMYPETDIPTIKSDITHVGNIELIEQKQEKLKALGIADDLAKDAAKSGKADMIINAAKEYPNLKGASIAETVLSIPRNIKRKENVDVNPSDNDFLEIFKNLHKGNIAKESVYDIFLELGKTGKLDFSKYELMGDKDLEIAIKKIMDENKDIAPNALMGKVMSQLKGKADGKKISEILQKLIK